jgi:transcriptional regulator with XRE-family HTH domain
MKTFLRGEKMEVGERIRQRREELNMTQGELAKKVGYTSRSSIAKIEANANGMLQSKLILFAKALQVTPAYIMGWEDILESETNDSAEKVQKRDDAIADIILKARRDEDLIELMRELCDLSPELRQSVKAFLILLKQQNVDNMK